jgi:hypothetical protein
MDNINIDISTYIMESGDIQIHCYTAEPHD